MLESIREIIKEHGIKNAVVLSAIGTLDCCVMHLVATTGFPVQEVVQKWQDKPLELSSINGIIADGEPHLHIVFSDADKAYSGHLEDGCRVLYIFEAVIMEVEDISLGRYPDAQGIRKLLAAAPRQT